jgi:hypothetical protein
MFSWILQTTFISIIFILLVHHLIQVLKDTLTYPKTKDLVNIPTKKYEDIYNVLNRSQGQSPFQNQNQINESLHTTPIQNINIDISREELLPKFESASAPKYDNNMKNELKNFIKKQQHQTAPNGY